MRKIPVMLVLLIMFMMIINHAHAWTNKDTIWETAYLSAHFADWGQTRDLARECKRDSAYAETNPFLGDCPSYEKVNAYFMSTALLHIGTAYLLPAKYRRMFQVGTLGLQINVISNNYQVGLKLRF